MQKIVKKIKDWRWLLFIFLLAFAIRVYKVAQIPYGIDGDEASIGYYAYSLITNLSDEYGNKLPLYFPSIGDYKYPGYSYLSTIPILLFGLSVFSTRFLSVLCGSLLAPAVYLLSSLIFVRLPNKRNVYRWSSLLVALSPYSIMFSRGAYESNVATLFLTLGIVLLLHSIKSLDFGVVFLSIFSILVSIFTYPSTRLFLLLFLPSLYLVLLKTAKLAQRQKTWLKRIVLFILVITCLSLLDARSRVRANDIGYLRDPWPAKYLQTSIHEDGLFFKGKNLYLTRLFHNKVTAHSLAIAKRYFQHFDPVYLFIQSNPNMPKYSIPNVGLFYFFEVITIFFGIYALSKIKSQSKWLVIFWLLFSVIPSSLSIETPSPIRGLIGLPAWIIVSALGVWFICEKFAKFRKIVYLFFALVLVSHFAYFWHQYTVHAVLHQPWYSDGGVQEMVAAVNKLEDKFDKVIISQDPYIHFLFFNKVHPKDFLADSDTLPEQLGTWERVERFEKIIFKMPYDCPKIGREDTLYVCRGEEIPQNSILLKDIYFPDGKPAFLLIEFVPYSEKTDQQLPERVHRMVDTDLNFPEALLPEDSNIYW